MVLQDFVAAERKTAISFLEKAKLVAEAQAELEPEVFKRAYEEAGWGFDSPKYLRVGRRTYLYKPLLEAGVAAD